MVADDSERLRTIEALHARYAAVLFDRCLRLLGNQADAEDAVQETFLQAFRGLETFEQKERGHLPWLYKIATNACLKLIRTRRRKGAIPTSALPNGQAATELTPNVSDPLEAVFSRQVLEILVDRFDDRTLAILIGHYLDGRSQGQIARQLGISRRSVVKRLTKLRETMRAVLEGGKLRTAGEVGSGR